MSATLGGGRGGSFSGHGSMSNILRMIYRVSNVKVARNGAAMITPSRPSRFAAMIAATNTAAGNEDILVRDSLDGGATFPAARVAQLNAGIPGPRFMPWVCTTGGEAFVTWYDRRNATAGQNDLTDYFGGRAFPSPRARPSCA